MYLMYDGVLIERTRNWLANSMEKYGYWIELKPNVIDEHWVPFLRWIDENSKNLEYYLIHKNNGWGENGSFLGFVNEHERTKVILHSPLNDLVLNRDPFKTVVKLDG